MDRNCSTCLYSAEPASSTKCSSCVGLIRRPNWFPKAVEAQIEGKPLPGAQGTGMKFDGGKPRWSLLMEGMSKALEGVAKVLTFGANKYAAHSWRTVPEGKERYRDALYRHLAAVEQGEELDPESGLRHWDHVICNALFLSELNR